MAAKKKPTTEERLQALEKVAHVPFDFTHLITRLEALEAEVKKLRVKLKTR